MSVRSVFVKYSEFAVEVASTLELDTEELVVVEELLLVLPLEPD